MTGPATVIPTASRAAARQRVVGLLADRRGGVVAVVLLTAVSTAATLAGPALVGVVVDAARDGGDDATTTVVAAAVAYAVLAIVSALLGYLAAVRAAMVGESALAELRTEVFDHALEVPIDVIERAGTGDLVSRVTSDVTVLSNAVRWTVPSVVFAAVEVALTVVALIVLDARLALLAVIAGTPPAAVGGWWYARHAPARYRREREAHGILAARLIGAYRGRSTLATYRASDRVRADVVAHGGAVVDAEMATTAARNRLRPSVSASLATALAATVVAGAFLVDDGSISIGAVTAAALYVVRLFDPVGTLLEQLDEVQQAVASTARLVGVTELPVTPTAPTPTAPTDHTATNDEVPAARAASVSVVGVSFSYVSGVSVLADVDLQIAAGERVVVIGGSGAGKSTLATLLVGMHRPDAGYVEIAGHRLDRLDAARRARLVAMVAQEPYVFSRSICDNVRLARPDAAIADVHDALHAVDAHDWVGALPEGIDTIVGVAGRRLSPPQAQQLALARLVCADPAVVVLDEATADLDPVAAARTERHLDAALTNRTVISIAHRLGAAAEADRVVVMDAGRIVAHGNHTQLLGASAHYRTMWQTWSTQRDDP